MYMYMYMYKANVEHVVFRTCTHQIEHVCVHSYNVSSIMYDRYMYIVHVLIE